MAVRDGSWVREWRQRNNYSQEKLAEELEVQRQTVMAWEKAPGLSRVVYLALMTLELNPSERSHLGKKAPAVKRGQRTRRLHGAVTA